MDPSGPVPVQSEDAQRGSSQVHSSSMDTGQRLVDRMPSNPKKMAFISTHERFEVPLRPELWSSYAMGGDPLPHLHQQPNPPTRPRRKASDAPNNARGRKKTVRRKRNDSEDPSGVFMADAGARGRKTPRSSHRNPRGKNVASDNSRRVTDYFPAQGNMEGHSSHENINPEMHRFQVPRMRDLLSPQLGCITGRPLQVFHEIFDKFDQTLLENTRAIHASLTNIVRAPFHLAEQCRPLIDEMVAAQRSSNTNITGESSRRDNEGHGDDMVDGHNVSERGHNTAISPRPTNVDAITSAGTDQNTYYADDYHLAQTSSPTNQEACMENDAHTSNFTGHAHSASIQSDEAISDHDLGGLNNLIDAIYEEDVSSQGPSAHEPSPAQYPKQSFADPSSHYMQPALENPNTGFETKFFECPPHPNGPLHTIDELAPESDSAIPSDVTGTLYVPKPRIEGKRLTRKPAKFCSPFKIGVMSRPPPNMAAALDLHGHLCAPDSTLRSTPVIQFGSTPLTGSSIAHSFSVDSFPDSIFMSGFVKCLSWDDYFIRPECHGYRIFPDVEVSAILNVEWTKRDTSAPKYSSFDAVASIHRCLPFGDLKKTKMILIPVLHLHHWSVYCVNLDQSRIDVLDSRDYSSQSDISWDMYHSTMGKTIMQRLSAALSEAAPHKFPSFRNWRHVPVVVPLQKYPTDGPFFAMKFLEFYDGAGHGSIKCSINVDRSEELRAEILYYLTYHAENKVEPLPDDLLPFSRDDHHPFFY